MAIEKDANLRITVIPEQGGIKITVGEKDGFRKVQLAGYILIGFIDPKSKTILYETSFHAKILLKEQLWANLEDPRDKDVRVLIVHKDLSSHTILHDSIVPAIEGISAGSIQEFL